MYKFTLIIPIYNEENNIFKLYKEIMECQAIEYIRSIIYIDDASTDNSYQKLKEISKRSNIIKLIKNDKNLGQSKSILKGIQIAETEHIITLDGDGQNDPKDIMQLISHFMDDPNYALIAGIRSNRKDNAVKRITSKIANFIRRIYLNDDCNDTGCALKIFERSTIINFPYFNGIHRFLPAIYKGLGKKCYFINVSHRYRIFGTSKYGTMKRLFFGIRDMIKVKQLIQLKKRTK